MPHLLRACALVLLVCAACDAGSEPRVGSPGLEPPRGTDDAGLGEDSDPGVPASGSAGSAGSVATAGAGATPPTAGSNAGSSAGSSGGAGVGPTGGMGNAAGAGGAGGATMSSSDAGVADAGDVPFSETHRAEIMKDCVETVQCLLQRDEQVEPNPIEACLEDSAAVLDADPLVQERFLANVERCSAFIVCDYYDCATAPPP